MEPKDWRSSNGLKPAKSTVEVDEADVAMSEGGNSSRQHRERQRQTVGLKKGGLPVAFKRVRAGCGALTFPVGQLRKEESKGRCFSGQIALMINDA